MYEISGIPAPLVSVGGWLKGSWDGWVGGGVGGVGSELVKVGGGGVGGVLVRGGVVVF